MCSLRATLPNASTSNLPSSVSHLSPAKCLAWCVSAVEDYAFIYGTLSIYGTLMRPIDIMVENWKSFTDNREQGGRVFIERNGPMEEEKGTTVDSRHRSIRGHRSGNREWGGGGRDAGGGVGC